MAQQRVLTPAERAENFARETRHHLQPITPKAGAEGATIVFDLPKTRMLAKTYLMVEANVKVTHASQTTFTPADFAPFTLLRRVRFEANNGFAPITLSGKELFMYSLATGDARVLDVVTDETSRAINVMPLKASSSGTVNKIRFIAKLPNTLNDRDPMGLIVLQNPETVAQIEVEFANGTSLLKDTSGYTVEVQSITVTPLVETFSIPLNPNARPDISLLKLVGSTAFPVVGAGEAVCKLNTGIMYRKLIFYVEDANGGVADDFITSDIEVVFNQADTPYRVHPKILAAINHEQFKKPLPKGLYMLDLSAFQGMPNYGGSRDYIDSSKLTEFWLRFKVAGACTIRVVHEQLSQLIGA